ncbi:Inner membrane protein YqaA [Burkholderiales bacterium]|nr:Inner membrane protein YqaA [Burkholderiales bacterium]
MTPSADALALLFASSFLSATLLPGNSEIVLAALVADRSAGAWTLIGVATVGNTLGGLTSYGLGRLLPAEGGRRLAPRAVALAQRYGVATLLLSWVPLIGDALCVASGWLRHNLFVAAAAIALGKFARYVAVAEGVRRIVT